MTQNVQIKCQKMKFNYERLKCTNNDNGIYTRNLFYSTLEGENKRAPSAIELRSRSNYFY